MKTIALYGFGYTKDRVHDIEPDEVWSFNRVWEHDVEVDRLFDLHPVEDLESHTGPKDSKHFEWLQEEHDFPIWMNNPDDRFPSARVYPLEDINERFFSGILRGGDPKEVYTSSMDYAMGMLLWEYLDGKHGDSLNIEWCGIEMGSDTEHRYQRSGGHFWMGVVSGLRAAGHDIRLNVPDDPHVKLLDQRKYAYEGAQHLEHDTMQEHLASYRAQRAAARDRMQQKAKEFDQEVKSLELEAKQRGGQPKPSRSKRVEKVGAQKRAAEEHHALANGACLALENLMDTKVVSRQTLEKQLGGYEEQRRSALGKANQTIGVYNDAIRKLNEQYGKNGKQPPRSKMQEVQQISHQLRMDRLAAAQATGAYLMVKNLIRVLDLKEPELELDDVGFSTVPQHDTDTRELIEA